MKIAGSIDEAPNSLMETANSLMETFKEFGNMMGLLATLIMLVLAITSNKRSMKFMRQGWKKLHRLAYLVAFLAILHLVLLERGDWAPYAIILVIGFLLRITSIKNAVSNFRIRRNTVAALS
jgi:sulfoxide reductase heme-binding subunit YedZ